MHALSDQHDIAKHCYRFRLAETRIYLAGIISKKVHSFNLKSYHLNNRQHDVGFGT